MNNHERKETLQILIDLYMPEESDVILSRMPIQSEDKDSKKFMDYTYFLQRLNYLPDELTGDDNIDQHRKNFLIEKAKEFHYPTRRIDDAKATLRSYE